MGVRLYGTGLLVPLFGLAVCVAVFVCLREEQFSLRLGHTRVLTSHRDVIHYARFREEQAPPLQSLCGCRLCGGGRLLRNRSKATSAAFPTEVVRYLVGSSLGSYENGYGETLSKVSP